MSHLTTASNPEARTCHGWCPHCQANVILGNGQHFCLAVMAYVSGVELQPARPDAETSITGDVSLLDEPDPGDDPDYLREQIDEVTAERDQAIALVESEEIHALCDVDIRNLKARVRRWQRHTAYALAAAVTASVAVTGLAITMMVS